MNAAQRAIAAATLACCAAGSLGFLPTPPPEPLHNVFMPGRVYGLGEQQVYLVERSETVTVRFRTDAGDVVVRTVKRSDQRSVAFTVEGYGADGSAVVAVSTDGETNANGDAVAVQPSPGITTDGRLANDGRLDVLNPANLIVGINPQPPLADGAKWTASGALPLPLGPQSLALSNVTSPWGGAETGVLQVASSGTFEAGGSVRVPEFGNARLRGDGSVTGTSFIDTRSWLLLGTAFVLKSNGNAASGGQGTGVYSLTATYTLKLMRYVAGLPPPPAPAGALFPASVNIRTEQPDNVTHQGEPVNAAHPAPTDLIFHGTPLPQVSPTPAPEVSLPPVPIPVSSGAPLASPPAPPPTPMPTRTPH